MERKTVSITFGTTEAECFLCLTVFHDLFSRSQTGEHVAGGKPQLAAGLIAAHTDKHDTLTQ